MLQDTKNQKKQNKPNETTQSLVTRSSKKERKLKRRYEKLLAPIEVLNWKPFEFLEREHSDANFKRVD